MDFIIKRKVFIGMFFIAITLLGYVSYKKLAVEIYPNVELPFLIVQVGSGIEVDPDYLEQKAIVPLEGVISTMEGIERITSSITPTYGIIIVSFKKNTNLKYSYLKLEQKVDQVKPTLPAGLFTQIVRFDASQFAGNFMELHVTGNGGLERLRNLVDKKVKNELENVEGVARVRIFGGKEKTIEVIVDPDACKAHGITTGDVRSALSSNQKQRTFVGKVQDGSSRMFVHMVAEYENVNDVGSIVVAKGPVFLKDVAQIYFGFKKEDSYSRINGQDAVTISITNDSQANMIELSHRTLAVIATLNEKLATQEVHIGVQSNSAETMENSIDDIADLAITGGFFAIYILWLFLGNIRIVSLIGLSIPISVYAAFNFFYAFDISINSLSLIGVALAVGMLVDNSVVVLENIFRHQSIPGSLADQSVLRGTGEVWRSIFASTLTTLAVFLPFTFSDIFLVKVLGFNVGISIVATLLISLIAALVLIPAITHFFISGGRKRVQTIQTIGLRHRLIQMYLALLKTGLRHPVATILSGVSLFFISLMLGLAFSVTSEEQAVTSQLKVFVTMQSGSSLETTDKTIRVIEGYLKEWPEVKQSSSRIQAANASISVELKEDFEKERDKRLIDLKNDLRQKTADLPNAMIDFEEAAGGGSGGGGARRGSGVESAAFAGMLGMGDNSESVILKGQDFRLLQKAADDLEFRLKSKTIWITQSIQPERPEVHLLFDQILLNELNIPLSEVGNALNNFSGEISTGIKFKQGNEEYDIIIKEKNTEEEKSKSRSARDLKVLPVKDLSGSEHDLQSVSEIEYATGKSEIMRVNQEKQVTLTFAYPEEAVNTREARDFYRAEIDQLVANYPLPSGVVAEIKHDQTDFSEYYFLIGAALLLIYMILASVFESLIAPLVLMFTIPLAAIGSILAIMLSGKSLLNSNALMGFIILIGVVVNNGIILLDYAKILRKRGFGKNRAIITSGISRVRPILITSLTTIVALVPLALGTKEYVATIGATFAITVIGGLSFSTILTLVFIPTCYSGLENGIEWIRNQTKVVQIIMLATLLFGSFSIYYMADGFLLKMGGITSLLIAVPALTHFLISSTRRAKTKLIADAEPIRIKIQNLVKVYERDGRFSREWNSGKRLVSRLVGSKELTLKAVLLNYRWQLPLLGFLIYFTYFRLEGLFMTFIFVHLTGLSLVNVFTPINKAFTAWKPLWGINRWIKSHLLKILVWGYMFMNLAVFYAKSSSVGLVVFLGIIWTLAIIIYLTARKLYNDQINVDRITGRMGGIRRAFYRLVKAIPFLGKRRQPFKALAGVSLEIETGMFGLLGPNGAGKTTMMRIICGILDQSYGKIFINGIDTLERREELQGLIGYLPQEFGTYENLTAWDYLDYQAMLKGITDEPTRLQRIEYVLKSVHMLEKKDQKIGSFSGGMKQRIGIAQILLHLPRILVVDEPTAGLDPRERIRFRNLLVDLSRERIVIFSTHVIEDISSSCNNVAVINKGALKYVGIPHDMTNLAEGFVWNFTIPMEEFEQFGEKALVVHHRLEGDLVRVRCVSALKPTPNAELVKPGLEDAYLCLLKNIVSA
ncbi:efflux RND transporter permease subunit [Williamwhitmania taraxaci]|uniref:Multidrug efflux pump subunit AcrB n=1 Tax=Williamwhitmania taraxaci TaxID=1640674 RepID=A0A1G6NHG8_9BACT|nr:efflux RND transporter permease subunit [Williamwhitmania taraxaci]SDC67380.1 Multidrug efflux pump subunit AcrB [Williamwhitmania taraxaci]